MTPHRRWTDAALWVPVAAAVALFLLPLVGLFARTPWSRLPDALISPPILDALRLSLVCSLCAAAGALLLGLPLAAWLARERSLARSAVRVLVLLPMVLPPIVGGVALLLAFGRNGLIGAPLERAFGLALPFTTAGVVLAELYVAMPFFVLTVESALRSADGRFAAAASTLGASRARVFRTVTLPMIAPAVRAGVVVAWARALGEFGATITFAGNLQGHTRTMPLAVFNALQTQPEGAIVLSVILVAVSAALLFVLRDRWFPVP